MNPQSCFKSLALCASIAFSMNAQAAGPAITKASTGADLTDGASWGGTAPGAGATATWESPSLGSGLTLGSAAAWDGIKVNGAQSDIDITGAGALTLGTGGIDLSGSGVSMAIANSIVLGGSQTWAAGSGLTASGPVSGTGTLTLDGQRSTTLTFSSFLSGSDQAIFTGASLGGLTLSDLAATNGLMGGAYVADGGINTLASTGYKLSNDGTTATYQMRVLDGGYTKSVKVELTQSGSDILGKAVYAKYIGGSDLAFDFDGGGNAGTISTGFGQAGYGAASTTAKFGSDTTITLSGNNTYDGGTVINGGLVLAGAGVAASGIQGGSFSTGDVTINAGATVKTTGVFVLGGGNVSTRTININGGTANITAAAGGGEYIRTLNLTGGTVTADSGTVYFRTPNGGANINSLASAGQSTIATGIDMTFTSLALDVADGAAAYDLAISGAITENTGAGSGAKSLTKGGAGTLLLSGSNTFTGGVTINNGSVIANNNSALGTGAVTLGATADNVSLYLGGRADVGDAIEVSAAGTGTVTIGANDTPGGGAQAATYTGLITLNRPTTFSGEVAADRLAFEGRITGNVGTLTISGGARTTFSSTASDFTGNINVTGAGTVFQTSVVTAGEVIPDATSVNLGAGTTFKLAAAGGSTETINALTGSGNTQRHEGVSGTQTLAVGSADGGGTYSGSLANGAGTLAFTKLGNGTQELSGASTYTGATLVSAGTLLVTGSLGNTAVTVGADGTIGGTGTIAGSLQFADGAMLNVTNLLDALDIAGTVTFENFGFGNLIGFDVEAVPEDTYTLLSGSNINLATGVAHVGIENAYHRADGKYAYFQTGSLQVVVVPEPGTIMLGSLGLLALLRRRRA